MNTKQTVTNYDFLYWQCRIRQQSVRQNGGRPSQGIRPKIILDDNTELCEATVLITKKSPENITSQFKHIVKKTQDPKERRESGIRLLSSEYYQKPDDFSDEITGLFSSGSQICTTLISLGKCILQFEQNKQRFFLPCKITDLAKEHPRYQATFWHNSLFNPSIPGDCKVLAFIVDWSEAESEKVS